MPNPANPYINANPTFWESNCAKLRFLKGKAALRWRLGAAYGTPTVRPMRDLGRPEAPQLRRRRAMAGHGRAMDASMRAMDAPMSPMDTSMRDMDATMGALGATMIAKAATMIAKAATMIAKAATMCAQGATMIAKAAPKENLKKTLRKP